MKANRRRFAERKPAAAWPIWTVLLLTMTLARPAHAYTDPGTGALLWQMLLAAAAALLFYLRKIGFWLKGRKGPRE